MQIDYFEGRRALEKLIVDAAADDVVAVALNRAIGHTLHLSSSRPVSIDLFAEKLYLTVAIVLLDHSRVVVVDVVAMVLAREGEVY